MPCGRAISVCLRGWARALLLAAAGLSRRAARELHRRGYPPRIRDAETVRTLLHGWLRPSRVDDGLLARPTVDSPPFDRLTVVPSSVEGRQSSVVRGATL